ncbi:glycosyltransferase [Hymenobacter sp. BT507]|uniref:Glycosyltransferase n=1 Tax=Hymenobacter citatus TaxID=2763506 RepID=A0ABR7MH88_9BACT|nr:glycosyltransferase [Hymenobacter citatus]MBC6610308.1 glycosyltransferase [Hymenobacter citatus]
MKVTKTKLLIIGATQGGYGGIEAFMIAVAEAAAAWPEFDVRLCFKLVKGATFKDDLRALAEKVCSQVYYVERGSKELTALVSWADVLHVQNMPPDIVLPAKLMGKKIFLTVHNRRIPTASLHNAIWAFTIKLAQQRWYNSRFVWGTWEPRTKAANSACIPTVCRLPQLQYPVEQRRGFLFVGRWINNKGLEEILQAYAQCNFDPEEWPLTILGDGPLKPTVLALQQELNLSQVRMPGFVDDESKQHYLASTRWLLAPARTQEDMGLTPIEARSVGVPAIVTRDGGLPESGGPAALLAEPGDVAGLADCMRQAAAMTDAEYAERSALSLSSLSDYLKPMEFYRTAFLS